MRFISKRDIHSNHKKGKHYHLCIGFDKLRIYWNPFVVYLIQDIYGPSLGPMIQAIVNKESMQKYLSIFKHQYGTKYQKQYNVLIMYAKSHTFKWFSI